MTMPDFLVGPLQSWIMQKPENYQIADRIINSTLLGALGIATLGTANAYLMRKGAFGFFTAMALNTVLPATVYGKWLQMNIQVRLENTPAVLTAEAIAGEVKKWTLGVAAASAAITIILGVYSNMPEGSAPFVTAGLTGTITWLISQGASVRPVWVGLCTIIAGVNAYVLPNGGFSGLLTAMVINVLSVPPIACLVTKQALFQKQGLMQTAKWYAMIAAGGTLALGVYNNVSTVNSMILLSGVVAGGALVAKRALMEAWGKAIGRY